MNPTAAPSLDLRALGATALLVQQSLAAQGVDTSWRGLKQQARATLTRDPIDTVLVTVLAGSYLFYLAERDVNPKITSFWDALVFITTCLSVGYADVFARSDSGKAIASFVMTLGPSLSASLLAPDADARRAEEAAAQDAQRALLERLDAILAELKRSGAASVLTP